MREAGGRYNNELVMEIIWKPLDKIRLSIRFKIQIKVKTDIKMKVARKSVSWEGLGPTHHGFRGEGSWQGLHTGHLPHQFQHYIVRYCTAHTHSYLVENQPSKSRSFKTLPVHMTNVGNCQVRQRETLAPLRVVQYTPSMYNSTRTSHISKYQHCIKRF